MSDRRRFLISVAAFALLAACHSSADDNARAASSNAAAGNTLAELDRLNPAQVRLVLFRAIRDADQDCGDIASVKRVGMLDGQQAWFVGCRGRTNYLVTIANDGTASVTDARRVRGIGQPGGPPAS